MSSDVSTYFHEHGIMHQTTCVDNQQNCIAEWRHRQLLEVIQSLMLDIHVPTSSWEDALLTTAYLINRMPSRVLNFKTPLEVCPHLSLLQKMPLQRCLVVCFVHIHG
jgi:hypothetical protein